MTEAGELMLMKELANSTRTDGGEFGGRHTCLYCGETAKEKKIKKWYTYYYCDCEEAKKEKEINLKIVELMKQKPSVKYIVQSTCMGPFADKIEENNNKKNSNLTPTKKNK